MSFSELLTQKFTLINQFSKTLVNNNLFINSPNYFNRTLGENSYQIRLQHNNLGLRMNYDLGEKNKPRISLLGDSFVYGQGLDSNETLDYSLNQKLNEKYEVINAGVSGHGLLHGITMFRMIKQQLQPDIIIVGIYVNDFSDNIMPSDGQSKITDLNNVANPYITKQALSVQRENILAYYEKVMQENAKLEYLSYFFDKPRKFLLKYSQIYNWLYNKRFLLTNYKKEIYSSPYFVFNCNSSFFT